MTATRSPACLPAYLPVRTVRRGTDGIRSGTRYDAMRHGELKQGKARTNKGSDRANKREDQRKLVRLRPSTHIDEMEAVSEDWLAPSLQARSSQILFLYVKRILLVGIIVVVCVVFVDEGM